MAIAFNQRFMNTSLGEKLKCTIQASGKLGFTEKTIAAMHMEENTAFEIYPDDNEPDVFYLIKNTKADEDAFPVKKSGKYYYINTKTLFDSLGWKYSSKDYTIAFDMMRDIEAEKAYGREIYKLVKRIIPHTIDDSTTE